jgi:hypothetical protein
MSRSLPLRIYRNFLIVAEGQIGGVSERQNFVLDTGTAPSIIDTRLARKLGSETTSSIMTVFGRTISTQSAIIREIELGLIHAVSLYVQVEDLSGFEREIGIPIAAIIGLDVLSKSSFRLDYDKKQIEFGDVSDSGIAVPFDERTGRLYFRSLGLWPVEVSVSQARDEVDKLNGKASAWKLAGYPSAENPFKKEEPASNDVPLFSELVEAYILHRIRAESRTPKRAEYDVRLHAKTHLADLMDRNLDQHLAGGIEELRRRLEVLLGARPEAPSDQSLRRESELAVARSAAERSPPRKTRRQRWSLA